MAIAAVNTSIHIELTSANVADVQRLTAQIQQLLAAAPSGGTAKLDVWVHQPPCTPARRLLMALTGGPVYRPLATVTRATP